jgi:hypothetical protein
MLRWLTADFGFRLQSEVVLIRPKSQNSGGVVGGKNITDGDIFECPKCFAKRFSGNKSCLCHATMVDS